MHHMDRVKTNILFAAAFQISVIQLHCNVSFAHGLAITTFEMIEFLPYLSIPLETDDECV